jgi:hypothetical protein
MRNIRQRWTWFAALLTVLMGAIPATAAKAQCASVSTTPVFVSYDPLSASDSLTQFTVTVTNNTCGPNTEIRFGFAKGPVNLDGTSSVLPAYALDFNAVVYRNVAPGVITRLDTFVPGRTQTIVTLSNGQSQSRVHTLDIAARQVIEPGSEIPFVVYAFSADQLTNVEHSGTLNVQSGFMLSVAGAGSSGLMDFGVLEADEPAQSINIHAQATEAYRITLASEEDGVLRNTAVGAGSHTVPYVVTLAGVAITELTPYQAPTASGTILLTQGTAILPLAIDLDTSGLSGLRAGTYRDILTLTISAEP